MNKEITLGQLLTAATSLIIVIVTGWITMNNKVTRLEARDFEREKQFERLETVMERMENKQDRILFELQNKKDK